jgi:pimeloyl-ACP methyl ester carboxylesterase
MLRRSAPPRDMAPSPAASNPGRSQAIPRYVAAAGVRRPAARAGAPRPFVLAGHSFGGMVARLYATNHPRAVAGVVSVDAQNEDYAAAYKRLLPPDVYAANPRPTAPAGAELPGGGDPRPRAERRPDAPGTGRHARHRPIRRCARCRSSSRTPGRSRNRSGYRPNSRSRRWRPRFRTHRTCWQASCRAPST